MQLTEQSVSGEGTTESSVSRAVRLGLRPPVEWRMYGLSKVPGMFVECICICSPSYYHQYPGPSNCYIMLIQCMLVLLQGC